MFFIMHIANQGNPNFLTDTGTALTKHSVSDLYKLVCHYAAQIQEYMKNNGVTSLPLRLYSYMVWYAVLLSNPTAKSQPDVTILRPPFKPDNVKDRDVFIRNFCDFLTVDLSSDSPLKVTGSNEAVKFEIPIKVENTVSLVLAAQNISGFAQALFLARKLCKDYPSEQLLDMYKRDPKFQTP